LVETLLARGTARDQVDAEHAVDRLALTPADNGWAIRELMLLRLRALSAQTRGTTAHDGHIAGLRRARGMGRGDEMILCRALTPSTVPLDALETVWLTTTQGGPLWASSSG
jgi:hypothetical protein